MTGRRLLPALALLAAAGFAVGLLRLFNVHFDAGDVYPAYSSLRADPLGAKALHDSLAEVGREPQRNYRLVPPLAARPATLLYLGLPGEALGRADRRAVEAAERVAEAGGRVVLCLRGARPRAGEQTRAPEEAEPPAEEPPAEPPPAEAAPTDPPWEARRSRVDLKERWGFRIERLPGANASALPLFAARAPGVDGIAPRLRWHSPLTFTNLDPAWQTLYTLHGEGEVGTAVAERPLGAGTLVLCSDSYPVSNEGLWRERDPEFLAWLLGVSPIVVFDEAHLGVVETPGVASVARDLGLLGALPALAVLFLLFAWQRGSALGGSVATPGEAPGQARDVTSGLVSLLRRSIQPADLLGVCLREWEKVGAPTGPRGAALRHRVRAAVEEGRKSDPLAAYRVATRLATERRGLRPEEPLEEPALAGVPQGGEQE